MATNINLKGLIDDSLKEYRERLEKEISQKVDKAIDKGEDIAWRKFVGVAKKNIKKIYVDTIRDFYNSYKPEFYTRQRSDNLYKLLIFDKNPEILAMEFTPSVLKYRNGESSSDAPNSLYDLVFKKGFHGGAYTSQAGMTGVLVPYARPPKAYDGKGNKVYSDNTFIHWKPAESTFSPFEEFKNRLNDYTSGEYNTQYNKIRQEEIQKQLNNIK